MYYLDFENFKFHAQFEPFVYLVEHSTTQKPKGYSTLDICLRKFFDISHHFIKDGKVYHYTSHSHQEWSYS